MTAIQHDTRRVTHSAAPAPTPTRDQLMDHEYDGIREYDNPTPAWWHVIFGVTVVFSIFYFTFWEFSPMAPTIQEAWQDRQVQEYKRIFGQIGDLKPDQDTILKMMVNDQMLAVAKGIFEGNCAACHAKDGGAAGLAGVNLTDNVYKNIKALPDLFNTISKGANSGAMPAWETRLGQNERIILAAYVATLRGTNAPGGKAPDGQPIDPWPPLPSKPAPATGSPAK